MDWKRMASLIGVLFVVAVWTVGAAEAAPPWAQLASFRQVEADPAKDYRLTEECGPWMIMACSFSGENAQAQAEELVLELRKRYKLPAYTHQMRFEFGETTGRGVDRYGDPLRMRHRLDELEEVAVLVGNYTAVDDPEAQQTLQKLKYSVPKCLEVEPDKPTTRTLAGWRTTQKVVQRMIGSEKSKKGPMGHAFITTNPMLPKEYFSAPGVDPLVVEMNEGVEHSLLDCPGSYTVQVACFKGKVVIDQQKIQQIENGKQIKSELAEAAMKAHRLTEALRIKGWEAYEFHDRYASIVTVGSFDSVGSPRPDGRIEINPKMHKVMQAFKADTPNLPNAPTGAVQIKSLLGIAFDIQPIPVRVPKRSIGRELARRPGLLR